jgi:DNA-binding NarL/FixJ family response regulator
MIRVFLVCDDPGFGEKLRSFFDLQDNFHVCAKTTPSMAALQNADKLLPDVAIVVAHDAHDFKIADHFKKLMPRLPLFLDDRHSERRNRKESSIPWCAGGLFGRR